MRQTIPVIGRLVALQSGFVAARTGGPVSDVRVEVGDRVEEGDILLTLDQARIHVLTNQRRLEIDEYQARNKAALAREKLASQELKRLERLRNTAAFAESLYDSRVQELDVATNTLRETDAQMERARYALELAEIELRDSTVRAPFPGIVTIRHTSEGAWLRVGDPVITLVNERSLEIEADVPADRVAGLKADDPLTVVLSTGQSTQGRVRAIVPDENPSARTRPVRIRADLDSLGVTLAANQSVTVLIPAGVRASVVSVHKDAVLRRGNTSTVFVVADGIANPRPVLLGDAVGGRFQVIEGLEPGEIVVVRGNERLRPGQAVTFGEQSSAAAPPQQPST
jgi:RND family efflux transporter MFP subunit